ncbi:MAG TPA: 5-(carboxyamino)imidazole ribonucleotide synthase [Devosiaceae bacterium]
MARTADAGHPMPPGTMIGILGGGQLGRMLATAAAEIGMRTHVFCPDPQSPAFEVTPHRTVAAYEDREALARFAEDVDIVTYEFENVPVDTAEFLADLKPLAPGAVALRVAQDRLEEKAFLTAAGIEVAPFAAVADRDQLGAALDRIGAPAVLKTTRLGYDGKGQRTIRSAADADAAFQAIGGPQLVLEAFIPFEHEISVIVARSATGEIAAYDPAENVHRDHILKTSTVPADIDAATAALATGMAGRIVEALEYVGVLGVEFFVLPGGKLLVNEIAPRVHNSGHWTQAGCVTSQFEQHIRAILGWPLGDVMRLADVVMENLIGDEIESVPQHMGPRSQPHVYGKTEARPGRKMGHINRIIRTFGAK